MKGNIRGARIRRKLSLYDRWRSLRLLRRLLWAVLLYWGIILIGLIPVNRGFQPSSAGVEVIFVSTAIHADIILPLQTDLMDWRSQFSSSQFLGDISQATHITFGWGDREFFTQTQALSNLRVSKLLKALFWPTRACMHVSLIKVNRPLTNSRVVTLSDAQFKQLVHYINTSFQVDAARTPIQIENAAHGRNDAFFEAHGAYHFFNTCNSWVGQGMQQAGIKTGWYTPLPKTMLLYLPRST